ncbi:MAG: 50S ribosomal protein L27 [Patescibacteria group bacterium]
MATKKSAGTTKNGRDSNPRYLGIKLYAGEQAKIGSIIIRQEGLNTLAGKNTALGRDYTIYATKDGIVRNSIKRKVGFNNKTKIKNVVNIE